MSKTKDNGRKFALSFLIILMPAIVVGSAFGYESKFQAGPPPPVPERAAVLVQESLGVPEQTAEPICSNLIVNSQLDVVDLGGGDFTAEPWQFLEPILYYVDENEPGQGSLAYDGYSLMVKDGDPGDPTPQEDRFAQAFSFENGLTSLTVEYQRTTRNGNEDDEVWGELRFVDGDGSFGMNVAFWDIYESDDEWVSAYINIPGVVLNRLNCRDVALVFYNNTDGSSPDAPAAEKEWMLFDDITLTACFDPDALDCGTIYLPTIQRQESTN